MLKNYIKIAFKVFQRRRFFTAVSLFGISFTLVVLMVVTAGLDHVFGPYPPDVHTDRTLSVTQVRHRAIIVNTPGRSGDHTMEAPASYPFLDRHVRSLPDVEGVSVFTPPHPIVSFQSGEKTELYLKRTDGAFWQILDFEFLEGGPFTEADDEQASMVAVINESTRERIFGGGLAVGRTIEVGGQRFRVVGVVANVPMFRLLPFADVWVPIHTSPSKDYLFAKRLTGDFWALILAHDPEDLPRIQADFQANLEQVEFPRPEWDNTLLVSAESMLESLSRQIFDVGTWEQRKSRPGRLLALIVALMGLFMVLPTLNLVNLNVSRILERSSEIGVRKAFGASSWTVVGQLVTENVLLTLIGGALGLLLSLVVLHQLGASGLIPHAEFRMNHRIFLYGLGTALFFGVFSGAYPAWRMSRLHPVQALRGGER